MILIALLFAARLACLHPVQRTATALLQVEVLDAVDPILRRLEVSEPPLAIPILHLPWADVIVKGPEGSMLPGGE